MKKQRSLAERLRAMQGEQAAYPAIDLRCSEYFPAAATAAECYYPIWLLRRLKPLYFSGGDLRCRDLLVHAEKLIRGEDYCRDGYELLYQVLIEPFTLMNDHDKEV